MQRRRRIWGISAALAVAGSGGVVACLGEDVSSTTPGVDSGADAGVSAGNVLPRGDFESGGCLGWTANEASLTLDPDAHGGSFACRVCASGDTAVWGVYQDLAKVPAGNYAAEGYLRASADAGPFTVVLRLQATQGGAEVGPQRDGQSTFAPGDPWARTTTEIAVEPGQGVAVGVFAQAAGGCFLVDDVTLVKR